MLRISRLNAGEYPAILKLEGRLTGPWVQELERVVSLSTLPTTGVVLEMADVTFADDSGVALLQRLFASGADVGSASSFVEALLRRTSDEPA